MIWKLKKLDNNGFVLAETLAVTVFLMVIFTMLYTNFYPLLGEYEKRETYDDVDSKYSAYWIKRIIEDEAYSIPVEKINAKGYARFECDDVSEAEEKREICLNLVKDLEIENCNNKGNLCEIYITKYRLNGPEGSAWFKKVIEDNAELAYQEGCQTGDCNQAYISKCQGTRPDESTRQKCAERANKKIFSRKLIEYVETLPDYQTESSNHAGYRLIVSFHHQKDNNNYYSYSTIEVNH